MSEIRFACPHCQQHIACDAGYVDMCIVCPTCGKPMVVPVLSASAGAHPEMCVVASIPAPRRTLTTRIPKLEMWQADEWEERLQASEAGVTPPVPHWVMSAFLTTILIGFLKAISAGSWIVTASLIIGVALSVYLLVKGGAFKQASSAYPIIKWTLFLIVGIPAIFVGIAFIGCCVAG